MSIDGSWIITVESSIGKKTSRLTFSHDGAALLGTAEQDGHTLGISDGRIDGNTVRWSYTVPRKRPITLEFTGSFSGDSMTGECKAGGFGSSPFTGEKA